MDVFCHIIPLTLITQDDRLTTGAWAARLVFPWPVGNETETSLPSKNISMAFCCSP